MTSNIATLHAAYVFDCEDCGRENLVRCIPASENDLESLREEFGDEEIDEADIEQFARIPNEVVCEHCGREYRAVVHGEEDIEE